MADDFRAQGHALIDQLADYLERAQSRALPVLPFKDPAEMVAAWNQPFTAGPQNNFAALVDDVLRDSNHLHAPRYVGHQVTAPLPLAALADLVAALMNNGGAVYEMGPALVATERHVLRWMAGLLGFSDSADGIFTSGGSMGNLTALLAARQHALGDVWKEGQREPCTVLVSQQAHYCVKRAVQIMGWGEEGATLVAVDDRFRMKMSALEDAMARTKRRVVAVVGSACSTATGSFDPLGDTADFAAKHSLWFHVDGAHGASASLSPKYRGLLNGIERADSVVWDAHKMLLVPALATAVVYRNGKHSYAPFAQQASYLFAGADPADEWFNPGIRTLECTKRMMALKLYLCLQHYGTDYFANYVTQCFDLGKRFAAMIRERPDFELAVEPECNIVCFRPKGDVAAIRERVLRSGNYYLVQTRLPAGLFLRVTLINPLTTDEDLRGLLDQVAA